MILSASSFFSLVPLKAEEAVAMPLSIAHVKGKRKERKAK